MTARASSDPLLPGVSLPEKAPVVADCSDCGHDDHGGGACSMWCRDCLAIKSAKAIDRRAIARAARRGR